MSALPHSTGADAGALSVAEIARLSAIASRESGIVLGPEKSDFLLARLGRLVNETSGGDYRAYCDLLEAPSCGELLRRFLESITTHTTSFFREKKQYDWLDAEGFPTLWHQGAGRGRDLVVWSAACSTGQELFTALLQGKASAVGEMSGLRLRGIGTDLSTSVVAIAQRAVYDTTEIAGIPVELRRSYLMTSRSKPGIHRISPELRNRTEWRTANLTQASTLSGIEADLIFLRNVLIYFDEATQKTVLRNVMSRLRPGGFLMTGHSETASARGIGLTAVRPTIYRKES